MCAYRKRSDQIESSSKENVLYTRKRRRSRRDRSRVRPLINDNALLRQISSRGADSRPLSSSLIIVVSARSHGLPIKSISEFPEAVARRLS